MHGPFFVGGTGRSGSTVVGYLLGAHSAVWATIPRELRFVTDRGGLLDLVYGPSSRIELPAPISGGPRQQMQWLRARYLQRNRNGAPVTTERFLRRLQGEWWERRSPDGEPRGLHRGLDKTDADAAIIRFTAAFDGARERAARQLTLELLETPTLRAGRQTWADTTPQNAENAHRILRMFPTSKVVHVVRDGRDTCASVLRKAWGPNDWLTALEWWRVGALKAHASMRKAGAQHGYSVQLEALVEHDRQSTLRGLFDFLELDVTPEVQHYFDERVRADRAHFGRWTEEVPESLRTRVNRRYEQIWRELDGQGYPVSPLA